jgi:rubrerythrin
MASEIDYRTLDMKDALDLAILIEEEARERYEEFVLQMEETRSDDAAAFFRTMAEYESKHGRALAERRRKLFGASPSRVTRSMVWEEEAPAYETVRAFLTAREAMTVALGAERKAKTFFEGVLPHVKDASVSSLIDELRREEITHEALVERELAKLPPPSDAATAADYADEPVAQ